VTYTKRRLRWRSPVRFCGPQRPAAHTEANLAEVAALLGVAALAIVPLLRYEQRHGHLILGHVDARLRMPDVAALFVAAPELFQRVEQAALVDQLQEECAAHERESIGRDLHDSAIQPYLGLKYAVEAVALRIASDNPARREVDMLVALVNAEVGELREFISGLRSGEPRGDHALLMAVRRQVGRFSRLFNIEVTLDVPRELSTSRRVAGALCHLVNEALNNVRKHTPARHVWVTLSRRGGSIELRVRDDAATVTGQVTPEFTPRSLSERVAALGGELRIERVGGLDTEVVIDIPLPRHEVARAADSPTPQPVCTPC
jgi:signal transduction histidine kinase